ncbi:hypothetical protein M422DRAFT_266304 [Sphaerobolus stellatus SS14]|uniref:Ubiquitin-like protease family profile domain-containing protein n=1 Tax=Sphaerobolus stellatus (strain SS14) TaxID=990650 RepID=A0A0C9URX6_SPHS4|nr:hypothetical protein M422DRAFT_266304 [Sphaerobolus stellatus SS14]
MPDDLPQKGHPPKKCRLSRGFAQLPVGGSDAIADPNIPVATVSTSPIIIQAVNPPQITPLTSTETLHLQLTLEEPAWMPTAKVQTLDLPWWFDSQLNETSFFGSFQIQGPQLQELINPMGRLSGSIISGYLSFHTKDITASQELPGVPWPFYIMDVSRTVLMSSQLTSGIFKPKLHMKMSSLWAETNISESQMILLPWHINRTEHWILIVLQMKEMQITVADSLTHSIQRHHHYICKRVVKFLEYEHDARGLGELPLEWGKKWQVYLEEKKTTGPLQQDIYSCGLHIIWVAQCLISGNNPFEIDELTKDIVQELQETITCRLSQEWTTPKILPLHAEDSDTFLYAKSIATADTH